MNGNDRLKGNLLLEIDRSSAVVNDMTYGSVALRSFQVVHDNFDDLRLVVERDLVVQSKS